MWGYGIGCGGWMILWWIGGLLAIGAVVYTAIRLASRPGRSAGTDDPSRF